MAGMTQHVIVHWDPFITMVSVHSEALRSLRVGLLRLLSLGVSVSSVEGTHLTFSAGLGIVELATTFTVWERQ